MLNQSVIGGGSVQRNENDVQGLKCLLLVIYYCLCTCTCIFKIINARGGYVGVKYGGCKGARDVST